MQGDGACRPLLRRGAGLLRGRAFASRAQDPNALVHADALAFEDPVERLRACGPLNGELDATVAEVRRLVREAGYLRTVWNVGPPPGPNDWSGCWRSAASSRPPGHRSSRRRPRWRSPSRRPSAPGRRGAPRSRSGRVPPGLAHRHRDVQRARGGRRRLARGGAGAVGAARPCRAIRAPRPARRAAGRVRVRRRRAGRPAAGRKRRAGRGARPRRLSRAARGPLGGGGQARQARSRDPGRRDVATDPRAKRIRVDLLGGRAGGPGGWDALAGYAILRSRRRSRSWSQLRAKIRCASRVGRLLRVGSTDSAPPSTCFVRGGARPPGRGARARRRPRLRRGWCRSARARPRATTGVSRGSLGSRGSRELVSLRFSIARSRPSPIHRSASASVPIIVFSAGSRPSDSSRPSIRTSLGGAGSRLR